MKLNKIFLILFGLFCLQVQAQEASSPFHVEISNPSLPSNLLASNYVPYVPYDAPNYVPRNYVAPNFVPNYVPHNYYPGNYIPQSFAPPNYIPPTYQAPNAQSNYVAPSTQPVMVIEGGDQVQRIRTEENLVTFQINNHLASRSLQALDYAPEYNVPPPSPIPPGGDVAWTALRRGQNGQTATVKYGVDTENYCEITVNLNSQVPSSQPIYVHQMGYIICTARYELTLDRYVIDVNEEVEPESVIIIPR